MTREFRVFNFAPHSRDTLTRGFFAHAKAAKDAKGGFDLGMRNAKFAPRLRDALTRGI